MPKTTPILSQTNPAWGFNKWKKTFRKPIDPEKCRFTAIAPMKLRNEVTSRGNKESDVVCISEMMSLFTCLKANDFVEEQCTQQSDLLQNCYGSYLKRRDWRKQQKDPSEPTPGSKLYTKAQMDTLLQRYPQQFPKKS